MRDAFPSIIIHHQAVALISINDGWDTFVITLVISEGQNTWHTRTFLSRSHNQALGRGGV